MNSIAAMRLPYLSNRADIFAGLEMQNVGVEVATLEDFHAILVREKARADRNGHGFSLVVYAALDQMDIPSFVDQVKQRLRTTDEIGWFDHNTLGVFLYNTPARGAWQFVNNSSEKKEDQFSTCKCSVYSYPNEWRAL